MFRTYCFLTKFAHLPPLDPHFHQWKHSFRFQHSVRRFNPRKPTQKKAPRNLKKGAKFTDIQNVEAKVYMRDTISNIYKILKYSTWDSAEQQLRQLPIRWDSFTVNQVLKTHPPMEKAWLFFYWASKIKGFKHDQFTYTTMLDIFGEAGRISSMKYVFQQMQEKGITIDAVTYTSVMHWVSRGGDVDGAVEVWEEMREKGCEPTVVSYTAYMKILFDNKRIKEATDLYKEMLQSGISPNCHTYTALMEHLIDAGKYNQALDIFNKMQEAGVKPDKAACNVLIEKSCKARETGAITQILQYMKEHFLVLRYPIFLEALKTLNAAGESDLLLRQVHPHISVERVSDEKEVEVIRNGSEVTLSLERELVLLLLKKQNLLAVDHLLAALGDKNKQLDPAIISTIIEANSNHCRLDGALSAFNYGVKMSIILERTAFLALIGILIRSNTFISVVSIVEEMVRAGYSLGVYLGSLLIYRLGCARRPTCAAKVFNLLPDDQKCVATYTALIGVYFSAGSADKGIKIYKTMQRKGIHPSLGTYNIILAGLEKLGRVSKVETYRKEKKNLQKEAFFRETVSMNEKICDLLFAGDVIS
ncbi:hypothetical protein SLE2022_361480 [Rubroshorea leprosula]